MKKFAILIISTASIIIGCNSNNFEEISKGKIDIYFERNNEICTGYMKLNLEADHPDAKKIEENSIESLGEMPMKYCENF